MGDRLKAIFFGACSLAFLGWLGWVFLCGLRGPREDVAPTTASPRPGASATPVRPAPPAPATVGPSAPETPAPSAPPATAAPIASPAPPAAALPEVEIVPRPAADPWGAARERARQLVSLLGSRGADEEARIIHELFRLGPAAREALEREIDRVAGATPERPGRVLAALVGEPGPEVNGLRLSVGRRWAEADDERSWLPARRDVRLWLENRGTRPVNLLRLHLELRWLRRQEDAPAGVSQTFAVTAAPGDTRLRLPEGEFLRLAPGERACLLRAVPDEIAEGQPVPLPEEGEPLFLAVTFGRPQDVAPEVLAEGLFAGTLVSGSWPAPLLPAAAAPEGENAPRWRELVERLNDLADGVARRAARQDLIDQLQDCLPFVLRGLRCRLDNVRKACFFVLDRWALPLAAQEEVAAYVAGRDELERDYCLEGVALAALRGGGAQAELLEEVLRESAHDARGSYLLCSVLARVGGGGRAAPWARHLAGRYPAHALLQRRVALFLATAAPEARDLGAALAGARAAWAADPGQAELALRLAPIVLAAGAPREATALLAEAAARGGAPGLEDMLAEYQNYLAGGPAPAPGAPPEPILPGGQPFALQVVDGPPLPEGGFAVVEDGPAPTPGRTRPGDLIPLINASALPTPEL